LRDLIKMGRSGHERVPRSLRDVEAWDGLNRGTDSWTSLGRALRVDELENLIRGLVLYGRATGRYHEGPLSPVTWLFRMIGARWPEHEAALGAWVVANRVNPYDPFGAVDDGKARTLAEYEEHERLRLRASLDGPARSIVPRAPSRPRRTRRVAAAAPVPTHRRGRVRSR
jgi:hypothetical protein